MWRKTMSLVVVLVMVVVALLPAGVVSAAEGRYFHETGFNVSDGQAKFLTEYNRFGGLEGLGYPISRPFSLGGFTYQAFQRGVLQWRPELGRCYLANVLDWLADAGKESFVQSKGVPGALADSANGDFQKAVAERESWLTDGAIAQAYRRGGGYERYGLPASRPVQSGPFVVQRFQRYVFQHWVESVPNMPPQGSVVGVLVGEWLRDAGIIPQEALVKEVPTVNLPAVNGNVTPPVNEITAAAEEAALRTINAGRASRGLPPLVVDPVLQNAVRLDAHKLASGGVVGIYAWDKTYLREVMAPGQFPVTLEGQVAEATRLAEFLVDPKYRDKGLEWSQSCVAEAKTIGLAYYFDKAAEGHLLVRLGY